MLMNNFIFLADTLNKNNMEVGNGAAAAALITFLFLAIIFAAAVTVFVFWVIALIHLIQHEDVKDRVLWLVLLFVVGGIIGPVYYFAVKKPYDTQKAKPSKTKK